MDDDDIPLSILAMRKANSEADDDEGTLHR